MPWVNSVRMPVSRPPGVLFGVRTEILLFLIVFKWSLMDGFLSNPFRYMDVLFFFFCVF